jgi:hypothetical protein
MIEPKTHTIEQPGAPREEVSSQPAADEELPSSGPSSAGLFPARNGPIAPATKKCDLMRSAPIKETKPS